MQQFHLQTGSGFSFVVGLNSQGSFYMVAVSTARLFLVG